MKYLGVDYGSKKVGFAESDGEGLLAFPLLIASNDDELVGDTLEIIKAMHIDTVVIGLSLNNKGEPNKIATNAESFAAELRAHNVNVVFEKEFFTSQEAKRQPEHKNEVDDAAAALILQRYLDKINPKKFDSEEILTDEVD
jgi:putative holliday junction resolvase